MAGDREMLVWWLHTLPLLSSNMLMTQARVPRFGGGQAYSYSQDGANDEFG
jgi:hypothetical protein